MPKLKTHSGTKDRIRVTKTGKLMHKHTHAGHNLSKKSAARKRVIGGIDVIVGKSRGNLKKKLGI
jgi:large subunit ribosomal protein L35